MLVFQKGFNFSQDGPGNRLVYHLQGCNFRCPWCSNPEGMPAVGKAREYSVDELADEAQRARPLFFDGGGVTFTGGECTLQHSELSQLLKKLRERKINTAIETNASDKRLCELLGDIDFFIADLKIIDRDAHIKYTGVPNDTVLDNLANVFSSGRQALIRIPLINGVNTNPEPFIDFFSRYDMSNVKIEVLPYHEYGKSKWTQPYTVADGYVSTQALDSFVSGLKAKFDVIST